MRWATFVLSASLLVGCDSAATTSSKSFKEPPPKGEAPVKGKGEEKTLPDTSPPKDGGEDYEKYVAKLKADTPVEIKQFQDKKLKADEYEADEKYPQFFRFVVLTVPRVYLTDKTTQKGGWYTKARLTLNSPKPAKMNSKGGISSIPEPFAWAKVEMLP